MVEDKTLNDAAPKSMSTLVGVLAAVAVTATMVVIGAAVSLGQPEANASQTAAPAADQPASAEAHRAFISDAHAQASRDGDDTPLPQTF